MNNRYLSSIIAAAALTFSAAPVALRAADHGDAPTVAGDQACDIADVYAFLEPGLVNNDNVILILTVRGFIVPGENNNFGIFDEDVRYSFNIENTGDAVADINIDVTFNQRRLFVVGETKPDLPGFKGSPRTTQDAFISFRGKLPPDLAGVKGKSFAPITQPSLDAQAPGRTITALKNAKGDLLGIDFFGGEADDPFFFDIPAFSRFVKGVLEDEQNPEDNFTRARDSFAGYNVMAIAIRVPAAKLLSTKQGAPSKIGVYATASRKNEKTVKGDKIGSGGYFQVDRLGIPGVNVAFVPYNFKNSYNGGTPLDDAKGKFITPIAGTLTALGTPSANISFLAGLVGLPPVFPIPRGGALGTGDMLRLETNKTTKPNDGPGGTGSNANGFPNGRRPGDDIIDIVLSVVSNGEITNGDNVNKSDVDLLGTFPFLALPQQPRDPAAGPEDNTRN